MSRGASVGISVIKNSRDVKPERGALSLSLPAKWNTYEILFDSILHEFQKELHGIM